MRINKKSWHYKVINYIYVKNYIYDRPKTLMSYLVTLFTTLFVAFAFLSVCGIVASFIGGAILERFVALDTINIYWLTVVGAVAMLLAFGSYKLIRKAQNSEVSYK